MTDTQPSTESPAGETAEESSDDDLTEAKEHGGPKGPEPTRYGDWEKNGRCIDF